MGACACACACACVCACPHLWLCAHMRACLHAQKSFVGAAVLHHNNTLPSSHHPVYLKFLHSVPFFQNGAKSGFEMCFGLRTLGAGAKTRLESRIKKFTPHCVCIIPSSRLPSRLFFPFVRARARARGLSHSRLRTKGCTLGKWHADSAAALVGTTPLYLISFSDQSWLF